MISQEFVHVGKLPSLNEYINAERQHRQVGARMRRDIEAALCMEIRSRVLAGKLRPVSGPVVLEYIWTEGNKRRDHDNVAYAQKFIQDALVTEGVLPGDGWKDIKGFKHAFRVGDYPDEYSVVVTILEEDEMDRAPVLKGCWVPRGNWFVCSECGHVPAPADSGRFCVGCGAVMVGKEDWCK